MNGYKVYIVGKKEDNYFDELVNLTKNLKVADIIEFTGPIYGEAKWNMYKDADVFVLPTFNENFGIVIPEALASGTPTITTIGAPCSYNGRWHRKPFLANEYSRMSQAVY